MCLNQPKNFPHKTGARARNAPRSARLRKVLARETRDYQRRIGWQETQRANVVVKGYFRKSIAENRHCGDIVFAQQRRVVPGSPQSAFYSADPRKKSNDAMFRPFGLGISALAKHRTQKLKRQLPTSRLHDFSEEQIVHTSPFGFLRRG